MVAPAPRTPTRSPAIDPADAAARGEKTSSPAGIATEAERDAAARAAGRDKTGSPPLSSEQAKMLLLDAARAFDPLKKLRNEVKAHPLVLVGVASGAGVVLGGTGASLLALSRLAFTTSRLIKPLTGVVSQFAMGAMAARAASAKADSADAESGAI